MAEASKNGAGAPGGKVLAWGGALVAAALSALGACGTADRSDVVPRCDEQTCDEMGASLPASVPNVPQPGGTGGTSGSGGVIEQAPPAGAPAEGLGVDESLVGGGTIGVEPTVGVDGRQRVPPGLVEPGGAPALPGPDDALSPPPGSAVDPVTGLEPPNEGAGLQAPGTGVPLQTVEPVPAQREPREEDFVF